MRAVIDNIRSAFLPKRTPREQLLHFLPKSAVCGEIGVWKGAFSTQILSVTNPAKLHLIDPWKYQTEFGKRLFGGKEAQHQEDMDVICHTVLNSLGTNPVISIHRNFSAVAVEEFPDAYFDWVYIDGNHYYSYVLDDLQNFYGKVKPGGYLTGDDFYWTSEELHGDRPVRRAVEDFVVAYSGRVQMFRMFGGQFVLKRLQ